MRVPLLGAFFLSGFLFFQILSLRFGPHPAQWRQTGESRDFSLALHVCESFKDDRIGLTSCMKKQILRLIYRWGYAEVSQSFASQVAPSAQTDMIASRCHDITHALGQAAIVSRVPISLAIEQCTPVCQAGCYHGVLEQWVKEGNRITNDVLSNVCSSRTLTTYQKESCNHGLGHTFAYISGTSLVSALSRCDQIDPAYRAECGRGVFMEFLEPVGGVKPIIELPSCSSFTGVYRSLCYQRSGIYTYNSSHDLNLAVSQCHSVPSEDQYRCQLDLGKYVLVPSSKDKTQYKKAREYCGTVVSAEKNAACMKDIFVDLLRE